MAKAMDMDLKIKNVKKIHQNYVQLEVIKEDIKMISFTDKVYFLLAAD